MARLPTVGEDNDQWGSILNEYLSVEHNTDGTQKVQTEDVSRTIYVATTGDDTTGDGTSLLPYLTIGKALSNTKRNINSGVTVTIHIGAGTFNMTVNDVNALSRFNGAGGITFEGEFSLVASGFTMGSADATDLLKYSVSGGGTALWSANQFKYYFLKSTDYYPITHCAASSISIAGAVTGTEIYKSNTIINISSSNLVIHIPINFNNLNVVFSSAISIYSNSNLISFLECYISGTGQLTFNKGSFNQIRRCSVSGFTVSLKESPTQSFNSYYYANVNSAVIFISSETLHLNCVYENPNTGTSARCLSLDDNFLNPQTTTSYNKIINSNVGFSTTGNKGNFNVYSTYRLIIVNVAYLLRKQSSGSPDYLKVQFNLPFSQILGTPNTKWFYDSMYEFVNPTTGRSIQISGIIYPESETNLSSTLPDNTTTNIIVGNKLQNRSITIEYTATRGTTYEKGRIDIVNKGATVVLAEGTPLGDDCGLTFAVDFNTNEIRLKVTTTATGTAVTFNYNATRVMITPLTI